MSYFFGIILVMFCIGVFGLIVAINLLSNELDDDY